MLPAYAGMIPTSWRPPAPVAGAPRVCGDDPIRHRLAEPRESGAPRVCGDDPEVQGQDMVRGGCSPRMRG